ncbi:ras and EF-hand domain-containing protein homolog isoform X1 [Hydra vulgaris]|uniref:ras and EF-hand domain-containing protein homolog isoform X1 n=1 Tax=Hydra vulgaris TaxID=6087 RepID=UPI001F5F2CE9|nr:ras and EF-hand domain-containing protein homolog isoform X1 [Hydra vulgaris]XP_047134747.1 ras and EF-hand domain-containing protein homolog isoform X1 [Hydra vulgaris]XP_047134748.1 ras and EF-hand domain-containing protein homolog isoform X1 [Hydra vulgaris]
MDLNNLAIELFKQFDPDNKGYITQEQLINGNNADHESFSFNQISCIFSLLDKENKGIITLADFMDAFIVVSDSNKDLQNTLVEGGYDEEHLEIHVNGLLYPNNSNNKTNSLLHLNNSEKNYDKNFDLNDYSILNNDIYKNKLSIKPNKLEDQKDSIPIIFESLIQDKDNFQEWKSFENNDDFKIQKPPSNCKTLNRKISGRCNSLDRNLLKRKSSDSIKKELDEIFKPVGSFTNNISCRSSFEDISKDRFSLNHSFSHNYNHSNIISGRNSLSPNSSSSEDLFYADELTNEEWESYLRRIGGVALFGGNQVLHYIWQQIDTYQKSLLLPLEDFLKGVIEEHKTVYRKYQDIENTLHLKIAQQEFELENIYEEFDRTMKEEQIKNDKKYMEREELLKLQFRNALDIKEQNFQENVKNLIESNEKLKAYEVEISKLISCNKKLEDQNQHLFREQQALNSTIDIMAHEKELMEHRISYYEENNRELQEINNQFVLKSEQERQKYINFIRQFKDMLEEKEFLEANLSNLSFENNELKNVNSILNREDYMYTDKFKIKIADKLLPLSSSPNKNVLNRSYLLDDNPVFNSTRNQYELSATISEHELDIALTKTVSDYELDLLNVAKASGNKLDPLYTATVSNCNLDLLPTATVSNYNVDTLSTVGDYELDLPTTNVRDYELSNEVNYKSLCSEFEEYNNKCGKVVSTVTLSLLNGTSLTEKQYSLNFNELEKSSNVIAHQYESLFDGFEKSSDDNNHNLESLFDELASFSTIDNEMKVEEKRKYLQKPTNHIRLACLSQTQFKVILCGDISAGKTSLIHRICFDEFLPHQQQTIKLDTYSKTVNLKENCINLILWDTCGQERFNSLPHAYYRKTDVVVLAYDLTNRSTFINTKIWFQTIHELIEDNTLVLLVGNKKDLYQKRVITTECGALMAKDNDALFIETSSKSNENINELIELIATTLLQREDTVIIRNSLNLCSPGPILDRKKVNTCC